MTVRSAGGLEITVDDGSKHVRIADKEGALQIVVSTSGSGEIAITATKGNVKLSAQAGNVTIEGSAVSVKSSGRLRLEGHPIDLNPPV